MTKRRSEAIWIEARHRWQINVQRDGERKTFTDSTPGRQGKHAAEAKADKWLAKHSVEQKFCDAWEMFITDKRQEVTAASLHNIEMRYAHITAVINESKRLSMITIYEWQKVLDTMAANGYKANTITQTMATITAFNNYALRRRWECEEIRAGMLQVPKSAGKAKEKSALSSDALKALFTLDDGDSDYIYLFQFLTLTGLRIGEARALKWSDISGHVLHLSRAVSADGTVNAGKTVNAARNIPLIPQAESVLDEQRALLKRWEIDGDLMFPNLDDGEALVYSVANYAWVKVQKLIGTRCTIHELRHTFISVNKSKLPLSLLKQVAGHSATMDTLKVYGHETDADIITSRGLIEEAFETCT